MDDRMRGVAAFGLLGLGAGTTVAAWVFLIAHAATAALAALVPAALASH